jgi:hypothetical protein
MYVLGFEVSQLNECACIVVTQHRKIERRDEPMEERRRLRECAVLELPQTPCGRENGSQRLALLQKATESGQGLRRRFLDVDEFLAFIAEQHEAPVVVPSLALQVMQQLKDRLLSKLVDADSDPTEPL